MTQRVQEILFACALVGVFVVYAYLSTNFGPNARMIPLPMAILGCLLAIAQVVNLAMDREPVEKSVEDKPSEFAARGNREMFALGGIVGMVALIVLLGPVVAIFIFTAAYLFVSGHFPLVRSLTIATLFTITLFLLFAVGLQLDLYHGILEPLLNSAP
ncbi:MAG: tripartite tricarboxylate transporter TctB family protein [Gammaproteobacteria bacterium]